MTNSVYFLVIFIFIATYCAFVNTLQCYTCMEKMKGNCYYGYTDNLKTLNCSKNTVCVTHQSETTLGYNSYISTTRGCEEEDICTIINADHTKTSKSVSVLCQTCNTTLCNGTPTKSMHLLFIVICICLNIV